MLSSGPRRPIYGREWSWRVLGERQYVVRGSVGQVVLGASVSMLSTRPGMSLAIFRRKECHSPLCSEEKPV